VEVIEIYMDTVKGTATLMENTALYAIWKITFGDEYLLIQHNYTKAETYEFNECSTGILIKEAYQQLPMIMRQIDQAVKAKRPKPPKRYR